MSTEIDAIRTAILEGAAGDDLAALPLPDAFRGALVRADEQEMFDGMASEDKDPRQSLHVDEVAMPELTPDEVFVAVMASSINFNTVWTSIFEPVSTFSFLKRLGKESVWGARHDQPFHVVGSDASGVVLRVGSAVRGWRVGDAVTVHCNHVDDQDPSAHDDSMISANQRIWGFESNYGGLAEVALVKANQLMPKPAHLTWEVAAVNATQELDIRQTNSSLMLLLTERVVLSVFHLLAIRLRCYTFRLPCVSSNSLCLVLLWLLIDIRLHI